MRETKVWLWREPDHRWKKRVLSHIKNSDSIETDEDIAILHCMEAEDFPESIPLTKYMLNLCKLFGIFKNERTMFLCPKDLLQAIELCLGRLSSKNVSTEIKVEDDEIVQCHKAYLEHFHLKDRDVTEKHVLCLKKFIEENNCADVWLINDKLSDQKANNNDYFNCLPNSRFLILGTPPSEVLQKFIGLLTSKETILNIIVETPLNISLQGSPSANSSSKIDVTSEPLYLKDIPFDVESGLKLGSATEEYVEETMISFLSLLVNSRNELALSKAMISPIIELSHEAFTKLKHLSEEKEMPMCQTAISYVTRIKLGGRGYAPPSDCPMLPHLKKIELFVGILNQMQTLIEEDLTAISAVKRLINILKKKLLKCSSDKLRLSSIETASENLKRIATKVLDIQSEQCTNTTPQVCDATLDFLHSFINYINCSNWNFDPKQILSVRYSKRTPISLPPLLGYFRSPEDDSSCDVKSVLDEESKQSSISEPPPFMSYFHHSESSSVVGTCIDSLTPSKTNFKDCFKIYDDNESIIESGVKESSRQNSICHKGRKRSILSEITNENPPEKIKKTIEKKPTKLPLKEAKASKTKNVQQGMKKEVQTKVKGSKKFKQIQGQGKITGFFIRK
ncbi:PCNA-interacting partner-like [Argiope bruennichi]|uniref:PCNA-interacting partner-like n=1 Tax=Argiope bruennichi TaxID=94029 RepID=UPI00249500CC|nr:PCNA-interacting partner-like [Argiope bruennichi]XP_055950275.1 PCNA-interacting partner-like [Argiope bruennichi]XP_055950276.1 PCNA-interacting partner-like [Argiope bruennichi]